MTFSEAIEITEFSPKVAARKQAILDAAEQVFTEKGFDVATMQDVAQACDMSPGNLYRYFPSKQAIVSGLIEVDRQDMVNRFQLMAQAGNALESFEKFGREYFRAECAQQSKMTMQIWAAASRQPDLQLMCCKMEDVILALLKEFVLRAKTQGLTSKEVDEDVVVHLIMSLAQSILRDAALKNDHDIERDLDIMFATIRAAFAGHIRINNQENMVRSS